MKKIASAQLVRIVAAPTYHLYDEAGRMVREISAPGLAYAGEEMERLLEEMRSREDEVLAWARAKEKELEERDGAAGTR